MVVTQPPGLTARRLSAKDGKSREYSNPVRALLGIGAGAIYALLGQGIVLIYRGSGVLNLAQGAYAMVAAYVYLQLHTPGNFGFGSFSTQSGWPIVPSFVVAWLAPLRLWAWPPISCCSDGCAKRHRSRG